MTPAGLLGRNKKGNLYVPEMMLLNSEKVFNSKYFRYYFNHIFSLFKSSAFIIVFLFVSFTVLAQKKDTLALNNIMKMSLEDLMSTKIISVSNRTELMSEAPAAVVVLTKAEIELRGYTNIQDIFDDLPGFDISRPWGSVYSNNYMRGDRSSLNDPYLLLVDGMSFYHLWIGRNDIETVVPISNIDKIEIVYGPSSVVYGANASTGVINIITIKDKDENGVYTNFKTSFGKSSLTGDYNLFYKQDNLRLSVTAKMDNWNIYDRINGSSYRWTNPALFSDRHLWGELVDNQQLAGKPSSPIENRGVDTRVYFNNSEAGVQYYTYAQGYGLIYPADKALPARQGSSAELSVYFKNETQIDDNYSIKTTFRYRKSDIPNTLFTEGYDIQNTTTSVMTIGGIKVNPQEAIRVIDNSSWYSQNSSWSISQNLDLNLLSNLSLSLGYEYEYKDLQKGWDVNYGRAYYPDSLKIALGDFYAKTNITSYHYDDRIIWKQFGSSFLAKYIFNENHLFNFGVRIDNNSEYGTSLLFRGGYILQFPSCSLKFLYGEAYNEPAPRSLYAGWQGAGSEPTIQPEKSRTLESIAGYNTSDLAALIDVYFVQDSNTPFLYAGGAKNLGKRNVVGLDLHFNNIIQQKIFKQLKLWAYASFILKEEEQQFDSQGNPSNMGIIGDLAHQKYYFGISGITGKGLSFSLRGRYIGSKETVISNPIRTVDGYFTADLNLIYSDLLIRGVKVNLLITNIFDAQYFQPGIIEANAGDTPGYWQGKAWVGSEGWYNSIMPQPGRFFQFGLKYEL